MPPPKENLVISTDLRLPVPSPNDSYQYLIILSFILLSCAPQPQRRLDDDPRGEDFSKDLTSVFFCWACALGVAHTLGVDAAATLAMGIQARRHE